MMFDRLSSGVPRGRSRAPLGFASGACLGFALVAGVFAVGAREPIPPPTERSDQDWRVRSFVQDAELGSATVFNLAFETAPASPRSGTVWFATSDGLREYDGYTWRRYGMAQGLPSDFVRCVWVDAQGRLWVGTDHGAGIYDGRVFQTLGSETGLAGPNVRRIVGDTDGTVWFCSDSWPAADRSGGLTSYRDGAWRAYRASDGLPSDYVINFHRDRRGRAWVVTLDGLAEWTGDRWMTAPRRGLGLDLNLFHWGSACFAETERTGLVCSTGRGLWFANPDGSWDARGDVPVHEHGLCATTDGRLLAAGYVHPHRRALMEWQPEGWRRLSGDFLVPSDYLMDLREAPDGSVWAVGQGCLTRWSGRAAQWHEYPGWMAPQFEDRYGRLWFGQPRTRNNPPERPVRFAAGRWERLDTAYDRLDARSTNGAVWAWTERSVTRWEGDSEIRWDVAETGLSNSEFGGATPSGSFWLLGFGPTGSPAVARCQEGQWEAPREVPESSGGHFWKQLEPDPSRPGDAWFVVDVPDRTNAWLISTAQIQEPPIPLPRTTYSLFKASVRCDQRGTLWLFGDAGLYRWNPGQSTAWTAITQLPARQVLDCIERGDELWFACGGVTGGTSGLARFRKGEWTQFRLDSVGFFSQTTDGTLLVPGDARFFQIANTPDAVPVAIELPVTESATAMIRDARGDYWIEAGGSVFRYRPDGTPPETLVQGPAQILLGTPLAAQAEAIERFRTRGFRTDARFRWRLDDGPWSAESRDPAHLLDTRTLRPGEHRLEVQSIDAGFDVDPSPAQLAFRVYPLPLQSRAWFLPLVIGIVLLLAVLAALAHSARSQVAGYARTLELRVSERTTQLRALAAYLEEVREDERTRISREVHDVLGQLLSALKMDLRWLARRWQRPGPGPAAAEILPKLEEATQLADTTIATVQRIAIELRPGILDALGLIEALHEEARRFEERAGVLVDVDLPSRRLDLPSATATALFRIVQELLTNIARHARASVVRLQLVITPTHLRLTVHDDGCGITPEASAHPSSPGLLGMAERAAGLRGTFVIQPDPAGGTLATITVPWAGSPPTTPTAAAPANRADCQSADGS